VHSGDARSQIGSERVCTLVVVVADGIVRNGLPTGNECGKREKKSVPRKRINERHGRKHGRVVGGLSEADNSLYKSICIWIVRIDKHWPHHPAAASKCDGPDNLPLG
jgi:hypothetical protein